MIGSKTYNYDEYVSRKKQHYKNLSSQVAFTNLFTEEALSKQFIPYYENQERIVVKFPCNTVKSGKVGVTTGWRPVFILMLTSRSISSSYILTDDCIIVKK